MSGRKKYPVKYSAETYKEFIHKKYDHLLSKINKLPKAVIDNDFYEGLKACVKKKSDLPFFEDFYDFYFTQYNIDSLIDIAYSLPTNERRMCRDLIISSILYHMDNPDSEINMPNKKGLIELSDVYYEIRTRRNLWYSDDTTIKVYLKKYFANRILNATYPLTGFMTTKKQEKNLKEMYVDYDLRLDKKRFFRLVQDVFDELSKSTVYDGISKKEKTSKPEGIGMDNAPQEQDIFPIQKTKTIETSNDNDFKTGKASCSQGSSNSTLIHDMTNIDNLYSAVYESVEEVELSISSNNETDSKKKRQTMRQKTDIDYAEQQKISQKIGDIGEEIVLQNEIDNLTNLGIPKETISKVRRVSLESDDFGFDILSFDEYGNERYLEVKTTKVNKKDFSFILTQNEFEHAKKLGNQYCIVIVFDIMSNPRIWYMGNPFIEEPYNVKIKPTQYRVDVSTL